MSWNPSAKRRPRRRGESGYSNLMWIWGDCFYIERVAGSRCSSARLPFAWFPSACLNAPLWFFPRFQDSCGRSLRSFCSGFKRRSTAWILTTAALSGHALSSRPVGICQTRLPLRFLFFIFCGITANCSRLVLGGIWAVRCKARRLCLS